MTARHGPGPWPLATPLRRLGGFLLDSLVYGMILLTLLVLTGSDLEALSRGDEVVPTELLLISLIGYGAYYVPLTALRGQTVGKMALRTKVVEAESGGLPGWQRSFIRWGAPGALSAVPWLGPLVVVMYAWLLWDSRRQGLHDKVAGTLVVSVA